jgi:hypothetical protein
LHLAEFYFAAGGMLNSSSVFTIYLGALVGGLVALVYSPIAGIPLYGKTTNHME